MKKLIVGLGLALAIILYFLLHNPTSVDTNVPFLPKTSNLLKTHDKQSSPSLNNLAKKKINQEQIKVAVKDTTSHPCNSIIEPLVETSLEEILETPQDIYINLEKTACQEALTPVLKNNPQLLDLEKRCIKKITPECDSLLFFLKTWAVSLKYPDDVNLADLDETILANKLMFNFTSNPSLPVEVLDKNIKILDEMLSKNPNLYGALKAKVIHLFAKNFQYNLNVEDEFNNSIDSLNSIKSDSEIEELLVVKSFSNKSAGKEDILEKINNFISNNPNNPKGPYYRAALSWNIMKNPSETKYWLEKAKSLAPNDPYVLYSLEKLNKAKPDQSIFYFSFRFDLQEV